MIRFMELSIQTDVFRKNEFIICFSLLERFLSLQ